MVAAPSTRWLYTGRATCSPEQFADLKFNILPRYLHKASYCADILDITLASKRAAQVVTKYFLERGLPISFRKVAK